MADQPKVDPEIVKALEHLGGGPPQPPFPPRPKPKVLTPASRVSPKALPPTPNSPKQPPASAPVSPKKPPATAPSSPTTPPISAPALRMTTPIPTPVARQSPPPDPLPPAAPAPAGSLAPDRSHPPASAAPPAEPRSPESRSPESRFRCLHCGYQLISANGFRCSECGTAYDRHVLERWFWGAEESRMDRVLWLVRACVFMKLWVLWDYRALAYIASAGAAGWACWIAGDRKRRTTAWQFAVGGMLMASLVTISAWWSNHFKPTTPVSFEIAAAGLLLGAMLRDADDQKLWREPTGSRIALALILAAPLLAIGFRTFEEVLMPALRESAMEAAVGTFAWNLLEYWVPVLIPHACAFAAWVVVWFWLARMRRAMFGATWHRE